MQILALVPLIIGGQAGQAPSAGTFQFVPTAELKKQCQTQKRPVPRGRLVLRDNGTFDLVMNDGDSVSSTVGRYVREGELIRFRVDEGLGVEIPQVMRVSVRGLNGRGAMFSRVAEDTSGLPPAPTKPPKSDFETRIEGEWRIYRNGIEDKSVQLTIRDGKFQCVMWAEVKLSSSGDIELDPANGGFTLIYREVDGKRLNADVVMRKLVRLNETGDGFTIEGFAYQRKA